MKLNTIIPLPPDDYLYNLGLLAYSIGYLEWGLLGDLFKHDNILPDKLKASFLLTKPSGVIADLLMDEDLLIHISDDILQNRMREFGISLKALSKKRNSILHAHPATIDGEQRFYRWTEKEQIEINNAYMNGLNEEIQQAVRADGEFRK